MKTKPKSPPMCSCDVCDCIAHLKPTDKDLCAWCRDGEHYGRPPR